MYELDEKKHPKCLHYYWQISRIRLLCMMDMFLSFLILVVLLDSPGQLKRNDDGMIRRIFNPDWILLDALILMVMVLVLVVNELNFLQRSDGHWNRYYNIIILV
jgi:hypothetical protein